MNYFVNLIWKLSCVRHWRQYQLAKTDVFQAQQNILFNIIRQNENTRFGKDHSFSSIDSIDKFFIQVPISEYDDYINDIKDIGSGHDSILTKETVGLFEPTSGSTSATKLIPYTKGLKKEFQRGIGPWIFDLFSNRPDLMTGSAYWSVSPVPDISHPNSKKIPVGFEHDTNYLGGLTHVLLSRIMAVPNEVKLIKDIESFRYVTLLFLLARGDLKIISVWHPTFLTILFDQLMDDFSALLTDINNHDINPPKPIDLTLKKRLIQQLKISPDRIHELNQLENLNIKSIWPALSLVSCWSDGPSTLFLKSLKQKYLHQIEIQGKGLIATEGLISFPLFNYEWPVLSINSHFFEFIPDGSPSETVLAHELELNKQYEVVLTTSGGLYRYKLRDIIEVMGFDEGVPLFRFVGKAGYISDLFGEKLSDGFVSDVVNEVLQESGLSSHFCLVAPEQTNGTYRYFLYLNIQDQDSINLKQLGDRLDLQLRKNYHYDYCRQLGQLKGTKIKMVSDRAMKYFVEAKHQKGTKLGDIKTRILTKSMGWSDILLKGA